MIQCVPPQGALVLALLSFPLGLTAGCGPERGSLDGELTGLLDRLADPPEALSPVGADPDEAALGRALFFDPILSGNKDTACATCHHPRFGLSDGLHMTLGTGATGSGPERADNPHNGWVVRNTVDVANRGDPAVEQLFWDGKIGLGPDGVITPWGMDPMEGLSGLLATQVLAPLSDPMEMVGWRGDTAIDGSSNEIATRWDEEGEEGAWAAIVARVIALPEYQELLEAAFPEVPASDWGIVELANAIAAYEASAYSLTNSPWDRYLRGDSRALNDSAKRGAILFYGEAACHTCHSGPLLTDNRFHVTGVPQIGPGKRPVSPYDHGREFRSGDPSDRFMFRTPGLRNVAYTGPYMHNGSMTSLSQVLGHYQDPINTIALFDSSTLHPDLRDTVQQDPAHIADITSRMTPSLLEDRTEVIRTGEADLLAFLESLTDPQLLELAGSVPTSVPSGLDVP